MAVGALDEDDEPARIYYSTPSIPSVKFLSAATLLTRSVSTSVLDSQNLGSAVFHPPRKKSRMGD
ncbi:hypothetical protein FRC08_014077, partial [Ceratobasidium sp. 394]